VVVAGPRQTSAAEVAAWCDRRRGIGADGVLVVTPLEPGRVRMAYWNADGSPAEMCGNGLRCAGRFAADRGWADGDSLIVETAVGSRRVELLGELIRAEIGPVTAWGDTVELVGYALETVGVGNPHAVAFVDDCYMVPVEAVGPVVEGDPAYPERTNVEFATVIDADRLAVRVWERGVGETLACGTGAVAAVSAAHRSGRTGSRVTVLLPGGELDVEVTDETSWITGPATKVFQGTLTAG
jgi:diaminopimelate epimerase